MRNTLRSYQITKSTKQNRILLDVRIVLLIHILQHVLINYTGQQFFLYILNAIAPCYLETDAQSCFSSAVMKFR